LTQIELFRFIGFHFVQKRGAARFADSRVRANLRRSKIGQGKGNHEETSLPGESEVLAKCNFVSNDTRNGWDGSPCDRPIYTGQEFGLPRRSHGLQGLARTANLEPVGAIDRCPAKRGAIDAGDVRRSLVSVCGDKLWLLPEGNDDEQHWLGNSDTIDDGPYSFRKLSEGQSCQIELKSPADPQTGIQFTRTIQVEADSPRIRFHASMKNITGHTLEWSMQSVSQYDTSESNLQSQGGAARINHDFWTYTPANPTSGYLNRYHVRFGPAENPAVSVRNDGLFNVHYVHMAAELWIDSKEGWLAVVDGGSKYAMVERFQYEESKPYPGKASVIFWTNGPEMRLGQDGNLSVSADPDASPYYLEAELNSPMCRLRSVTFRKRKSGPFWIIWSLLRRTPGSPFL
jgi:hypothetical protein